MVGTTCETCPTGSVYDSITEECLCPTNKVWDLPTNTC